MTETTESEFQAWEEDATFLVKTLAEIFESEESRFYIDDINNILYVELKDLNDFEDDEIIEMAEPVLSELDLDFEDVILLPLRKPDED